MCCVLDLKVTRAFVIKSNKLSWHLQLCISTDKATGWQCPIYTCSSRCQFEECFWLPEDIETFFFLLFFEFLKGEFEMNWMRSATQLTKVTFTLARLGTVVFTLARFPWDPRRSQRGKAGQCYSKYFLFLSKLFYHPGVASAMRSASEPMRCEPPR